MKNKSFNTLESAYKYYDVVSQNYVAFLILNREEDKYEVINQDLYDHYAFEFDLDMVIMDFVC